MSKWIKIIENDSFIVEFNKATNTYRVSYFEDYHFKDEICFRGYEVVHGAWEKYDDSKYLYCSNCGEPAATTEDVSWHGCDYGRKV